MYHATSARGDQVLSVQRESFVKEGASYEIKNTDRRTVGDHYNKALQFEKSGMIYKKGLKIWVWLIKGRNNSIKVHLMQLFRMKLVHRWLHMNLAHICCPMLRIPRIFKIL